MVTVILKNSETKVNQNNTVSILKLYFICPYNKISKQSKCIKTLLNPSLYLKISLANNT